MIGSLISSTRTPQITPLIAVRAGLSLGASAKNVSKSVLSLSSFFQRLRAVACQPGDHLIDLSSRASLLLRFGNVVRINTCEAHRVDPMLLHEVLLQPRS